MSPAEPILAIIVSCIVVTYLWRGVGVWLGVRIKPDSAIFDWISCVAYALLAGLMARVLLQPAGLLTETSLSSRVIAMLCGFAVFFALKRNILFGTGTAIVVFFLYISFFDSIDISRH